MRLLALVVGLMLAGCNEGPAPPALDMGVVLDEGAGDGFQPGDGGGGGRDLSPIPCTTACDCPDGQRCNQGACQTTVPMVFCCGTAACSGDSLCQERNGAFSQCSLPPDAGARPTDGGAAACGTTSCVKGMVGNILCELACGSTSATCVSGTGGSAAHCMP